MQPLSSLRTLELTSAGEAACGTKSQSKFLCQLCGLSLPISISEWLLNCNLAFNLDSSFIQLFACSLTNPFSYSEFTKPQLEESLPLFIISKSTLCLIRTGKNKEKVVQVFQ
jgi:hypothetical protein